MEIEMARGDIYSFSFGVYLDDAMYTGELDNIYFTVKRHHYDHPFLFQKKLSDGTIASDGAGAYVVVINPEDTDNLNVGEYDFDIEIVKLPEIKRTFAGTLILTKEVTHRANEAEVI